MPTGPHTQGSAPAARRQWTSCHILDNPELPIGEVRPFCRSPMLLVLLLPVLLVLGEVEYCSHSDCVVL